MRKKILSKTDIVRAMKHTKSNMAAARFLGCSYPHYKQYAKLYKNSEGKTLFDAHLNRQGRGISKHLYKKKRFNSNNGYFGRKGRRCELQSKRTKR